MTTTQIKVTKKKPRASARAAGARVVEVSVKRVKREPAGGADSAPPAKSRTAVVKTPARRGRSA